MPCDNNGAELTQILSERRDQPFADGLVANCSFSSKPPDGYRNYHEKMTAYVGILEGYAKAIDPTVSARIGAQASGASGKSVFRYPDAASSRAQTGACAEKLELPKVVIIGLGGTGSYILDLVAKTWVEEIHLYDPDIFHNHNAFRAPGAPSGEELDAAPKKVDDFHAIYERMHEHVVPHDCRIDETNVDDLRDASFVFLAIDGGPTKKVIIEALEGFGVPFIDTGIGVYQTGDSLGGLVRTTTSSDGNRRHVWDGRRISFADVGEDEYDQNIQVADLNMLNAALAVLRWKRMFGFYLDLEHEHSSTYEIDGNHLLNEDHGA